MAVLVDLATAVSEYIDFLAVEKAASDNTVMAYRSDLGRYQEFCSARGLELADISSDDVGSFIVDLRSGDDDALSARSVARALVSVRGLHKFCVQERWLTTDVAHEVTPPAMSTSLPKALRRQQVDDLFAAVTEPATALELRNVAILEVLYGCGCRVSELIGIDLDDYIREESLLRLHGKGNKTRLVPVGSAALAAIDSYLVRGRPELVAKGKGSPALLLNARGGRLSRQAIWQLLRRFGEAADLPDLHPHTLRHSYATHLLEGGADIRVVQELLGHSSVATTQVYTQVTADHLREVYLTSHPRAKS